MEAASVIRPSCRKRIAFFSPRPSISSAPRKCLISWNCWPGQPARFGQIVNTPSPGFTVAVPHNGHFLGGFALRSLLPLRFWITGETTCGITSPARSTTTSSPSRTSLRSRSSSLCRVAVLTVTPLTWTGSSIANGSRWPVRPTFQTILLSLVVAVEGGNFQATAQRGSRPATPSSRCSPRSSTLTTTPSISKSSWSRRSSHQRHRFATSSTPLCVFTWSLTGKPRSRSHSSISLWLSGSQPPRAPMPYVHSDSGRDAVILGSSWRNDPAAEFRGLAKVGSPASARWALSSAKAAIGR